MSNKRKYKFVAAFLLTVFSLNTVVGFACSLGVDMGFNSKRHHDGNATEAVVHIHEDGKRHIHFEKKEDDKSHHHNQVKGHHKSKEEKGNCCTDQVLRFEQLDKSVPQSLNIIHPVFLIAFTEAFYTVILPSPGITKDIKQFVRSYHPPIPDIRTAIQSFQI
jgi:hypothetical protein